MPLLSRGCLPCRTRRVKVPKLSLVGKISCSIALSVTKAVRHAGDVLNVVKSALDTAMKRRLSSEARMTGPHANRFVVVPLRKVCPGPLRQAKRLSMSLGLQVESSVQMIRPAFPPQRSQASASLHRTLGPRPFLKPWCRPPRIRLSRSFSRDMSCIHVTMALRRAFSSIFLVCSKRSKPKEDWLCAGLFGPLLTLTFPTIRAMHSCSAKKRCIAMD
jgi:hypothetical protein